MKRFDKAAFGHLYINQLVGVSERRDQEERLDFTTKDAKIPTEGHLRIIISDFFVSFVSFVVQSDFPVVRT